jgi:hypothetical protein
MLISVSGADTESSRRALEETRRPVSTPVENPKGRVMADQPATPAASIADLWRERVRLLEASRAAAISEGQWEMLTDKALALETAVLNGQIGDMADAIAKLEAIAPSLEYGEQSGETEAEALADVIGWLVAHYASAPPDCA